MMTGFITSKNSRTRGLWKTCLLWKICPLQSNCLLNSIHCNSYLSFGNTMKIWRNAKRKYLPLSISRNVCFKGNQLLGDDLSVTEEKWRAQQGSSPFINNTTSVQLESWRSKNECMCCWYWTDTEHRLSLHLWFSQKINKKKSEKWTHIAINLVQFPVATIIKVV